MKQRRMRLLVPVLSTILLAAAFTASPAAAHCDSMDGPVVNAARAALERGDVTLVLHWVRSSDEAEIRAAFERTLRVRAASAEARELADVWFFETLVRVHRAGEGAPYTGLKPAGWKPPALITAADAALVDGGIEPLAQKVSAHVARELHARYERVMQLKDYAPGDVEAGRRYVEAYVAYTHYLEALYHLLHGAEAEPAGSHGH